MLLFLFMFIILNLMLFANNYNTYPVKIKDIYNVLI